MNFFKRHIGDYHKKAGRLTMLEHGAYTLLMDACYDRERFPTKEEALDWCWARSAEETAAVEFVLSKFFTLEDGVYKQARIQEEIDAYHAQAEKNREIALAREEARRQKRGQAGADGDGACTNRAGEQTKESTNRAPGVHEPSPNHKPLTTNQEPESSLRSEGSDGAAPPSPQAGLLPDDLPPPAPPAPPAPAKPRKAAAEKDPTPTALIWRAYKAAYRERYGVDPVHNAKVMGQLSQLLARLGAEEAPQVATFYVGRDTPYYRQNMHSVDALLRDAEKLRTEWMTAGAGIKPPSEFHPSRYGPAGARSI